MNSTQYIKAFFACSLLWSGLMVTACNDNDDGDPRPYRPHIEETYRVVPDEANLDGCLNLEKLLARVEAFPSGTMGRIYTTNIQVTGTRDTRDAFITYVTRANFRFEEEFNQDTMMFDSANQTGCARVSLIKSDLDQENYQIIQSSDTSLSMIEDGGKKKIEISLLGAQSIQIHMIYPAVDVCNNMSQVTVDTTQVLEWGDADLRAKTAEVVSADMLKRVSRSARFVPTGISDAVQSSTNDQATVTTEALRQLKNSEVKLEFLGCIPQSALR